ncbi:MAG: hypothetical protein A2231_00385 [Candidatus Firestonebacteria bacterium RIFOXYA2_FULL_40_8]|nr:MAG: hypothetical protein A2231_00385 [Candidatus Firestonebacteria bacterium RIFOXYA2_FULL_40_8]
MDAFLSGILTGLATGAGCVVTCVPVLLPYLVSEGENYKKSLRPLVEFLAGRFVAYTAIGLLFGIIGKAVIAPGSKMPYLLLIISGVILLLYGLVKQFPEAKLCAFAGKSSVFPRAPFFSGVLMGVNICPPFAAGLTQIISNGSIFSSFVFMTGFFLSTSLFLLPLSIFSLLGKTGKIRSLARIISILVGIYFIVYGTVLYF